MDVVEFCSNNHCGKALCEPDWKWEPRAPISDYDIWYVCGGEGELQINGEPFAVRRGVFALLCPGDSVKARHDPHNRLTVIYIHFNWLGKTESGVSINGFRPLLVEEPQWLEALLQRALEVDRWETKWRAEEFDLLLKLVFIGLARERERQQYETPLSRMNRQRIQQITDYIRLHMREKLSPQIIGDLFECSPRYLSRMFKQYTGYSLKIYITQARMERAAELLAETAMTVTQIADAVGYADLYYFSKLFKSVYHASPLQYRFKGVLAERHTAGGMNEE
ncbi:AraC family transcriptional regulator [Paenibacillus sp. GCM10027626]|uniref:AraC family transcriptional regulator n=1 Tax=Paenibacillus sp. GCM10027626 TaxID=3273411 RepID=UPI00362A0C75